MLPNLALADAGCVSQQFLENYGHIAGRAADDVEDFRGGGLLLQRFVQFPREAAQLWFPCDATCAGAPLSFAFGCLALRACGGVA